MTNQKKVLSEVVAQRIHLVRGRKVLLRVDLASLNRIETRTLVQAVERNPPQSPLGFMIRLSNEEWAALRSQTVTSTGRAGRCYAPYASAEHGTLMLSSVFNSTTAADVSLVIVRTFVQLSEVFSTHEELAAKIDDFECKVGSRGREIATSKGAVRQLMQHPASYSRPLGFTADLGKSRRKGIWTRKPRSPSIASWQVPPWSASCRPAPRATPHAHARRRVQPARPGAGARLPRMRNARLHLLRRRQGGRPPGQQHLACRHCLPERVMIMANIIHGAWCACCVGVPRLLLVDSSTIYPCGRPEPIKQDCVHCGLLERTDEPDAISKIADIMFCESTTGGTARATRARCPPISSVPTTTTTSPTVTFCWPRFARRTKLGSAATSGSSSRAAVNRCANSGAWKMWLTHASSSWIGTSANVSTTLTRLRRSQSESSPKPSWTWSASHPRSLSTPADATVPRAGCSTFRA